jgi:hypothetical protein
VTNTTLKSQQSDARTADAQNTVQLILKSHAQDRRRKAMTDHHPECEDVTGAYPGSCTCAAIRRKKAMDELLARDADLIGLETGPTPEVTEADRNLFILLTGAEYDTAQRIHRGLIYTWEVRQIARHRLEERAKIVAWLRAKNLRTANYDADDIEAGEHLK